MNAAERAVAEERAENATSLDPADWESTRVLAHRMLDDMLTHLRTIATRPAWRPTPADVRERLARPVPTDGVGLERAYADFVHAVLPYGLGNTHPRFWGWVVGTGTVDGVLADMLASAMNPNVFDGDQAAAWVEAQVLDWCKELLGIDPHASGVLVSGCAVANAVALAVARHARAGVDWAGDGMSSAPRTPVLYCSEETHNSVDRGARLVGLGRAAVRRLPTQDYRLRVDALESAVTDDLRRGRRPFCVVANAGTVNTGAIDDLDAIADVAAEHDLWLHVDGAFGAWAALVPEYRERLAGLSRADSVAFDFHKWMYLPYAVACVLIRDGEAHRSTFAAPAQYLARDERGVLAGPHAFGSLGIELGRDFRALKVWMGLKTHGRDAYAAAVERNVAQARYLAELVARSADFELCAPVTLNVVCFRARAGDPAGEASDALNRELLLRLQESGVAVLSSTRLGGRLVLRAAVTNHRTQLADFDVLLSTLRRLRADILAAR